MKKNPLLLSAILITAICAKAQIYIMPKVGFAFSHMQLANDISYNGNLKAITGFTGGGAIEAKMSKFFSWQAELLFVTKGYSDKYTGPGYSYTYSQKISYLEIPLLAKGNLTQGKFKAFVLVGPSVAYGLGGKFANSGSYTQSGTIDFKSGTSTATTFYYNKNETNQIDIGLQFGGGLGYELGPGVIILDARYGMGFIDLYKKAYNPTAVNFDNTSKYRVFALTIGYAIKIAN
jgi:hypothetical protein